MQKSINILKELSGWARLPAFHRMVLSTALTNAILTVLSTACTVLVSRALGVEAKGVVSWMTSYGNFSALILGLGFGAALTKNVAKNQKDGSAFIILNFIILAVGTLILLPVIYGVGISLEIAKNHQAVFILSTLLIPLLTFSNILSNILIAKGKSTVLNLRALLERVIIIIFYVLLLISGYVQPITVMMAAVIGVFIRLIFSWGLVRSFITHIPTYDELWQAFVVARKLMAASYFHILASSYTGAVLTIILGILSSSKELGYFSIASAFIAFGQIIPGSMGAFILPNLSQEKDLKNKRRKKRRLLLVTFAIMLVTALPLYIFPQTLIALLFGQAFLPAAPCLQVMATGMIASSMLLVCQPMIASHHREWRLVISSGSLAGMITVLTWLCRDNLDALAAAYIYSAVYTAGCLIGLTIVLYNYFDEPAHA